MRKDFLCIIILIFLNFTSQSQQNALVWKQLQPGIWKASVGKATSISLLKLMENEPQLAALNKLPPTSFPLLQDDIVCTTANAQTTIHLPLQEDEAIYGLGLNFQTVNQRGRILNLHVDHYGNSDNGRTHAPVPFYVSSKGYGVLIDAAQYMTFYVGTANKLGAKHPPVIKDRNTDKSWEAQPYSDAVEVSIPGESVDLYIFAGPSTMNVVQRYNLFNGGGCLPPLWGLGFTQRLPTLSNEQDVLHEINEFEARDFPLDFIGLEPGWQSSAYPCTLEWDSTRFPHPKQFLNELLQKNIRVNLWFNPYLSPKTSLYKKVLPFAASHTVWNGIVPDITMSQARELLKEHFVKNHLDNGVAAYKIDEVDGYDNWIWPDVATFPSGHTAEQMRQVYGMLWQKMTLDWFKEKNQRTYGLVRASNAGASSMPYVIYNDYYSHKDFITALINSSFIGVLWVPEVRGSDNAEEWIRRMQSVCFSPMAMLDAWSDGTKPWTFPEVEKGVHEIAMLRMQLLPYFYNTFAEYHFEGKPPFRAMPLIEGFDYTGKEVKGKLDGSKNPYALNTIAEIKDQYMAGDFILVAPMFSGEKDRKVYLPAGKWYDFYTGNFVGENEVIDINPPLNQIPLFVKDGGIIPMIAARRQAPVIGTLLPITVRHYGTAINSAVLYDDDGISFNYEKGDYTRTLLSVRKDKKGNLVGTSVSQAKSRSYHYEPGIKWIFMTAHN